MYNEIKSKYNRNCNKGDWIKIYERQSSWRIWCNKHCLPLRYPQETEDSGAESVKIKEGKTILWINTTERKASIAILISGKINWEAKQKPSKRERRVFIIDHKV